MYLYIGSIGKGVKNPKTPHHSYIQTTHPPVCIRFFYTGGSMDVMCEGRRLNLTIGQLFCQHFFEISIFWR